MDCVALRSASAHRVEVSVSKPSGQLRVWISQFSDGWCLHSRSTVSMIKPFRNWQVMAANSEWWPRIDCTPKKVCLTLGFTACVSGCMCLIPGNTTHTPLWTIFTNHSALDRLMNLADPPHVLSRKATDINSTPSFLCWTNLILDLGGWQGWEGYFGTWWV